MTTDEGPLPPGQALGARVVVGGASDDWYLARVLGLAGGVSRYGGWGAAGEGIDEPEPAWVFAHTSSGTCAPALCSARRPKRVAEVATHEAGHAFGLRHQGETLADGTWVEYYRGHGVWCAPLSCLASCSVYPLFVSGCVSLSHTHAHKTKTPLPAHYKQTVQHTGRPSWAPPTTAP